MEIKTIKKDCCVECGFPIDMKRKPVFITNNTLSFIKYRIEKCENCGHQKSGWTINSVYEYYQKILSKK